MDKVLKSEINFGLTFLTLVFCKNFKLVAETKICIFLQIKGYNSRAKNVVRYNIEIGLSLKVSDLVYNFK